MRRNKKVCLLGAAFETNNMGVGALAAGAIKIILNAYPRADIILLDYGRESINYDFPIGGISIPIKLINMRFSKKLYLKNNIAMLLFLAALLKTIPFKSIRAKILSNNSCLKHVSEADLILSLAGGDSFSDIYGIANFLYVTLPQVLILLMRKDLILMPQTLGPYKGRIAKLIAKYILNHAKTVFSRDYASLQEIKTLPGVRNDAGRLRFCYDVGFVLDPVKPAHMNIVGLPTKRRDNSFIVGFNVSGLLYMGGYTRNNMFGLKRDYDEIVHKVIDHLIKQKNVLVMLVPHVFGSRENTESDSTVCQQIYKDLKDEYGENLALVQGNYNQNEIKYIIGLCDFFIGSRMHACIAALSQSIPTVSIAYSKKFIGVMETIGAESLVADPRVLGIDEIIKVIDDTVAKKDAVRKHLEETMPRVKETVLNLFHDIENGAS
jgi:colanic acid/amylovoran biosynthesis protein